MVLVGGGDASGEMAVAPGSVPSLFSPLFSSFSSPVFFFTAFFPFLVFFWSLALFFQSLEPLYSLVYHYVLPFFCSSLFSVLSLLFLLVPPSFVLCHFFYSAPLFL